MFNFLKQKVEIPTEEKTSVETMQSWTFSWDAPTELYLTGRASITTKHKVFISREDMQKFSDALKEAYTLLGCKYGLNTHFIEN